MIYELHQGIITFLIFEPKYKYIRCLNHSDSRFHLFISPDKPERTVI